MADLPDGFWKHLLYYIEEGTVIPVIGPELVTVREDDGPVPLDRWIAQRLAVDLKLSTAELPAGFGLNDVVSKHLRIKERKPEPEREELYALIHRMLRDAALTPSPALGALARIPGFNLYISLTFDWLLADALRGARRGPLQITYAPNNVIDLAHPKAELQQPVVFQMLGLASASPGYSICDDDLLEFVHALQDKQRQPKRLFDELRGNHLLILGCSFGDWLTRFFLRTARSLELSQKRKRWDVFVGDGIAHDVRLGEFLESFSLDARIAPGSAARFVTELAVRWHAAHPVVREAGPDGRNFPPGAVFVSYASDDFAAANRLAEGLRAAGLDVWFDKDDLQWGNDWARSIRRAIEQSSLFLPVISRQSLSEENRRRYFWREWNAANDLACGMAPGEAYILPVVIDDTRIDHADLHDSFKRAQGTNLPDGKVTPAAANLLIELVRDFHRRQRAA